MIRSGLLMSNSRVKHSDAYGCDQLLSQAQDLLFSNFAAAAKTSGFIELSRTLIE